VYCQADTHVGFDGHGHAGLRLTGDLDAHSCWRRGRERQELADGVYLGAGLN